VLSQQDKKNLSNIAGVMKGVSGPRKDEIINRQLCHFFRADMGLGTAIAQILDVVVEEAMPELDAKQETAFV